MSPPKSPSPDRQKMLYSSHLQGMEPPVQSLKSFTSAAPPLTDPDKSLPPVPPPLQKNPSSSSLTIVRTRSTGLSLWESPSNWDNNDSCHAQSTPPLVLRHYSPLIPEPPEDIAAMQANPVLWQQGHGPFQQTPLDPIRERAVMTPEVPPRNPSRLSLSLSNPATARKSSKDTLPSIKSRYSIGTHDGEILEESTESAFGEHFSPDFPSPLDLVSALSDTTVNEQAFNSLGVGSPRDQGIIWGGQHQRSDSVQLDDNSHLDLQGNKLTMFRKRSILPNEGPTIPEDLDVSDKVQALSFAQDYHTVLADRSFDNRDQSVQKSSPGTPPKDRDLTPQPLAWKKEASCSPPAEVSQRPQLPPTSSSGRYKTLRKMGSWVHYRRRKDSQTRVNRRSVSDPESIPQSQLPKHEVDQHLKSDAHFADVVQHGKDLVSRKILRRDSPKKPVVISHPLLHRSPSEHANPSVSAAPFELATPVFRLPGGLAVVRHSPLSTPRPQTASDPPCSPLSDLSWPDFTVPPPFHHNLSRRGSWQSTASQPQATSANPFRRKFSSPLGSPSFLRSFSHSTSSLSTPVRNEEPSLYDPPQTRRRSHNIGSPLIAPPSSHDVQHHTEYTAEGVAHKLNLFEKARYAHDSWKKHQKEAKNEKLKQSIRLVGPADARDIAGYIKCAIDGRVSGDSGIGDGQLPSRVGKEVS